MKKIVLYGELMLRLKAPGKERFLQTPAFEAVFGGSEANVAVSLAQFGRNVEFVTALPNNPLGEAAAASLRYYGVNPRVVKKDGRLGLYFLEGGACQRPSRVIYDREQSCFSLTSAAEYDWETLLSGAEWFHVSGVTPALTQITADSALCAMRTARKSGAMVSLDLNFRKKLWNYGKNAVQIMTELSKEADVLIANEEDIQNCLGIALDSTADLHSGYRILCQKVRAAFPNALYIAVTLRQSISADVNGWTAVLSGKNGFYTTARYEIENIVERVGAGDAFAAGLIYGLLEYAGSEQKALDFACAAGCVKHSVPGDFNITTTQEVLSVMNGNLSGRIQR